MSYIFSRALVEAYLEANCSDSTPSAPSSSNPIPQAYCSPDRMTAYSRLSRFGMTYAPLTDDHGAALLTWYLEASRARTSARQVKVPALMAPALDSGGKCTGLLARYDLNTSLWKTPQCSLLAGLDVFLGTWPRAGMMRNGWCWGRMKWVPRMSESACGYLLSTPPLGQGMKFATPQARDFRTGEARRWEDPARSRNLNDQIAKFPTPTSRDWKDSGSSQGNRKSPNLGTIASRFPTPRTKGMCGGSGAFQKMKALEAEGIVTTEERKQMTAGNGGQLNPTWTEWLMGWPLEWTALKPLATDKFRQWRQLHSGFCSADSKKERRGNEIPL